MSLNSLFPSFTIEEIKTEIDTIHEKSITKISKNSTFVSWIDKEKLSGGRLNIEAEKIKKDFENRKSPEIIVILLLTDKQTISNIVELIPENAKIIVCSSGSEYFLPNEEIIKNNIEIVNNIPLNDFLKQYFKKNLELKYATVITEKVKLYKSFFKLIEKMKIYSKNIIHHVNCIIHNNEKIFAAKSTNLQKAVCLFSRVCAMRYNFNFDEIINKEKEIFLSTESISIYGKDPIIFDNSKEISLKLLTTANTNKNSLQQLNFHLNNPGILKEEKKKEEEKKIFIPLKTEFFPKTEEIIQEKEVEKFQSFIPKSNIIETSEELSFIKNVDGIQQTVTQTNSVVKEDIPLPELYQEKPLLMSLPPVKVESVNNSQTNIDQIKQKKKNYIFRMPSSKQSFFRNKSSLTTKNFISSQDTQIQNKNVENIVKEMNDNILLMTKTIASAAESIKIATETVNKIQEKQNAEIPKKAKIVIPDSNDVKKKREFLLSLIQ